MATSSSTGWPASSATGLPGPSAPSQSSFMLPPSAEGADADCQGGQARVLRGTMPLLCPGVTNHLGAGINNNVIYSTTRALRFSDTKTCKRPAGRWLSGTSRAENQKPRSSWVVKILLGSWDLTGDPCPSGHPKGCHVASRAHHKLLGGPPGCKDC